MALICADDECKAPIHGVVVWLGERDENGQHFEMPFHRSCSEQPWPLYETRRTPPVNWRHAVILIK